MRVTLAIGVVFTLLALVGCGDESVEVPPTPHQLTAEAIGHYCGMSLMEHAGPKGQIILASRSDPVWFSSARDAFAFTMLAEEPKDIRAIYVSDMARAPSWDDPGAANWVDAHRAFFVIGSSKQGGMGARETVPFSDRAAADKFVGEHGGKVVAFADVPRDYVLSSEPASNSEGELAQPRPKAGTSGSP
jgi:copper chaperone NosL